MRWSCARSAGQWQKSGTCNKIQTVTELGGSREEGQVSAAPRGEVDHVLTGAEKEERWVQAREAVPTKMGGSKHKIP
jgi:hypothetical protein